MHSVQTLHSNDDSGYVTALKHQKDYQAVSTATSFSMGNLQWEIMYGPLSDTKAKALSQVEDHVCCLKPFLTPITQEIYA